MKITKDYLKKLIKEEIAAMEGDDKDVLFDKLTDVLSDMSNGFEKHMEHDVEDVAEKMGMTEQELVSLLVSEEKYDDDINYYVDLVIKTLRDGPENI